MIDIHSHILYDIEGDDGSRSETIDYYSQSWSIESYEHSWEAKDYCYFRISFIKFNAWIYFNRGIDFLNRWDKYVS